MQIYSVKFYLLTFIIKEEVMTHGMTLIRYQVQHKIQQGKPVKANNPVTTNPLKGPTIFSGPQMPGIRLIIILGPEYTIII